MATDDGLDVRIDVGSCQTAVAVELGEDVVLLAAVHDRADETDIAFAVDALEGRLREIARDEDDGQQAVATDGGATE